jgi:predicted nucleotidyltransferase
MGAGTDLPTNSLNRDLVRRFRRQVEQHVRVDRLLLFGSRARGTARPTSDYDFIVVSSDFEGVSPLWRGHGLNVYWNDLEPGVDVELLCLTPAEFAAAVARPTSWLQEAAREGVEV